MSSIKEFYNQLKFPGPYQVQQLDDISNRYLLTIDQFLNNGQTILDVGCGTGLIANLFARRYPNSTVTAIDFADGIDFAREFAKTHSINNVEFIKQDWLTTTLNQQYDVVICQGVLHHIPDIAQAVDKIKQYTAQTLIVGLYHPWGKIPKRWLNIDYKNNILYHDQEQNPYETAYTVNQVKSMFSDFDLVNSYPSYINIVSHIEALFNYKNGGLITYVFKKHTQKEYPL